MGTPTAPIIANLLMWSIKNKLLTNHPTKPVFYKRCIDDILIWQHDESSFDNNHFHPTLEFTHTTSTTSVDFLDIAIFIPTKFLTSGELATKSYF